MHSAVSGRVVQRTSRRINSGNLIRIAFNTESYVSTLTTLNIFWISTPLVWPFDNNCNASRSFGSHCNCSWVGQIPEGIF
jgi:hypothetical protein